MKVYIRFPIFRLYHTVRFIIPFFQLFLEMQCLMYKIPLKLSTKLLNEAVLVEPEAQQEYKCDINLRGSPGQGYYVEMAVGTPPQLIDALVDTGSSNFAVAASPHKNIEKFFNVSISETVINLGFEVSVPYTQGIWKGFLGQDIVKISSYENSSGIISNVAFITESEQFFISGSHWEAILGLGYRELAKPSSSIEPFFDSLVKQMNISNIFSLHLCGLNGSEMAGSLILGGVDHSLHAGALEYIPIYKEWYYEVIITDIYIGETSLEMDCKEYNFDKTIVDSGTTNLLLPIRVYNRIVDLLIEKVENMVFIPKKFWEGLELLCWKNDKIPWESFPTVTMTFSASYNFSIDLVISPHNYLRQMKNEDTQFTPENVCYQFSIAPSDLGTVVGAVVMEGFYIVFDREASKLGFGTTACHDTSNHGSVSFVRGPYYKEQNTLNCAYIKLESHFNMLLIATVAMGTVCILCITLLVLLVIRFQVLQFCLRQQKHDQFSLLNEAYR